MKKRILTVLLFLLAVTITLSSCMIADTCKEHDFEEKITKPVDCQGFYELTKKCKNCDTNSVLRLYGEEVGDHQYGEWETIIEPTTTAPGLKTRTCTVCQETQEEVIPPFSE